jgi:hypothetical protein
MGNEKLFCLYRCGTICLDKMAAKIQDERHREPFLPISVFLHVKFLIIPRYRHYRARELRRVTSVHVTRTEELKHVQLYLS